MSLKAAFTSKRSNPRIKRTLFIILAPNHLNTVEANPNKHVYIAGQENGTESQIKSTATDYTTASDETSAVCKKDFYFTTGQRRSIKLVYDGYYFVKFMENSKGIKWICATRSSTKCRARLRTSNGDELEVLCNEHNHDLERSRSGTAKVSRPKSRLTPNTTKPE